MANRYHLKIQEIMDLYGKQKKLTPEAINHLRDVTEKQMMSIGSEDFVDALPFIVTYTYNEAYRAAITDVLEILRRR